MGIYCLFQQYIHISSLMLCPQPFSIVSNCQGRTLSCHVSLVLKNPPILNTLIPTLSFCLQAKLLSCLISTINLLNNLVLHLLFLHLLSYFNQNIFQTKNLSKLPMCQNSSKAPISWDPRIKTNIGRIKQKQPLSTTSACNESSHLLSSITL